jgi:hypothetical protein
MHILRYHHTRHTRFYMRHPCTPSVTGCQMNRKSQLIPTQFGFSCMLCNRYLADRGHLSIDTWLYNIGPRRLMLRIRVLSHIWSLRHSRHARIVVPRSFAKPRQLCSGNAKIKCKDKHHANIHSPRIGSDQISSRPNAWARETRQIRITKAKA